MKRWNLLWRLAALLLLSALAVTPLSGMAGSYEDYRDWMQGDARWGSMKLGSSGWTMAAKGCLVTSVAKLIVQAGLRDPYEFDPGIFLNWLNANSGFEPDGDYYWGKAAAFGLSNAFERKGSYKSDSKSHQDMIIGWIQSGYHLVLNVDGGSHWVAVDEGKTLQTNTVYIMDSRGSTGKNLPLTSRYPTFTVVHAYTGGAKAGSVQPYGALDLAAGGGGSMRVAGWALDPDTPDQSLEVHFYVGGKAGSGASGYAITADRMRTDLGGNYGFDVTIAVRERGAQPIYLYAINTVTGHHPCIGTATVTIRDPDPGCTVTFDANGGSVSPSGKTITGSAYGELPVPARTGYTFAGWYTSADGGTMVTDSSPVISASDHTLYAHWTANTYTLSYDANGGTVSPAGKKVTYGMTYGALAAPTRAGFAFLGWYTAPDGGTEVTGATAVTTASDHTIYAHWQRADAYHVLALPDTLTSIEAQAFAGTAADAVVIPDTVVSISPDAFDGVVLYGRAGGYAESYAAANGKAFIPITDAWVSADAVPNGAHVVEEKWTYTQATTETTTSTAASMPGWTQAGFTWQQTGTGVWQYADFPGGFDPGNSLYDRYHNGALGSTSTDTTMREAGAPSLLTYIYWHWTFVDRLDSTNHNVVIENARKLGVNVSGSVVRDFIYFDAFETAVSLSKEGMGTGGLVTYDNLWSTYHHPEYDLPEYASWWWYRLEVMQQPYTDYQKLFTYVKYGSEDKESTTAVEPAEGITNIRHWVKYAF